jgi:hypothetical protein
MSRFSFSFVYLNLTEARCVNKVWPQLILKHLIATKLFAISFKRYSFCFYLFVETEHARDKRYNKKAVVYNKNLTVSQLRQAKGLLGRQISVMSI